MEITGNYTVKFPIEFDKEKLKKEEENLKDGTKKSVEDAFLAGLKAAFKKSDKPLTDFGEKLGRSIQDNVKKAFRSLENYAVNLFKSAASEMSRMLEFSQLSNRDVRELAFGYGFSSSQAYGWDKAMTQLGFSSEEDLMYANAQELQQFRAAFEKYSKYYDDLAESGYFEKMQEYELAMEDFKMEMQQEVIGFFIENKDTIVRGMQAIMSIANGVLKIVGWLFRRSDSAATTADIVSQYNTTTTSNSNASLNVTNNFNNVDNSVSSDLSREVNMEYRQVIKALGGDV